jgi:hypothetical protein
MSTRNASKDNYMFIQDVNYDAAIGLFAITIREYCLAKEYCFDYLVSKHQMQLTQNLRTTKISIDVLRLTVLLGELLFSFGNLTSCGRRA